MGPRFTVSIKAVARSRLGAAGLSREPPNVITEIAISPRAANTKIRVRRPRRKDFFIGLSTNLLRASEKQCVRPFYLMRVFYLIQASTEVNMAICAGAS